MSFIQKLLLCILSFALFLPISALPYDIAAVNATGNATSSEIEARSHGASMVRIYHYNLCDVGGYDYAVPASSGHSNTGCLRTVSEYTAFRPSGDYLAWKIWADPYCLKLVKFVEVLDQNYQSTGCYAIDGLAWAISFTY